MRAQSWQGRREAKKSRSRSLGVAGKLRRKRSGNERAAKAALGEKRDKQREGKMSKDIRGREACAED